MSDMEEIIELSYKSLFKSYKSMLGDWQEIYEKWKDDELLKDIEDDGIRMITAVLLDNQWLYKNQVQNNSPEIFMDVIAKVYPNLLAHQIVSVQPLLTPVGFATSSQMRKIDNEWKPLTETEEIQAKTGKLKAYQDNVLHIDADDLASQIINEINGEVLKDLCNNCGTVGTMANGFVGVAAKINEMRHIVSAKSGRIPNWLVVNKKTYEEHEEALIASIMYIHVDENMSDNVILMGWQGKINYYIKDSAYIYSPYVPLTHSPVLNDQDFVTRPGFMTRYGKRLMRNGAATFAKINLE